MPEFHPRLPCPVCLGVNMEKVLVGRVGAVEVDHCKRCGGVWLEYGEVRGLRAQPAPALWNAVARRKSEALPPCHSCHAPFRRDLDACPSCGWKNVLDCPACDRPMKRETRDGLHLDVCRRCKGIWFDHHELDAIWNVQASLALKTRPGEAAAVGAAGAGDILLDVMWFAPEIPIYGAIGAAHAVSGLAQGAAHVPELAAAAPEAAVGMVEAAGEAAGGVFEVLASILEGIFGLLDF